MSLRNELHKAVAGAAKIRRSQQGDPRSPTDIIAVLSDLDIPVIFRPLKGLLGATVTVGDHSPGVLITTERTRAIQRYTLAHELGHVTLGHRLSFDAEVGVAHRGPNSPKVIQEKAADQFASDLLAPRAKIMAWAKSKGWTRKTISEPANIYQLSLRLGISFQASCWALANQGLARKADMADLASAKGVVRDLKRSLLDRTSLDDSWADVWLLDRDDVGVRLEAGENDLFVVMAEENASTGYRWQVHADADIDTYETESPTQLGGPATRGFWIRPMSHGPHQITFENRRPWTEDLLDRFDLTVCNWGRETEGLPRSERAQLVAEVAA